MKRLSADDSVHSHVKVGHRQALQFKKNPVLERGGVFYFLLKTQLPLYFLVVITAWVMLPWTFSHIGISFKKYLVRFQAILFVSLFQLVSSNPVRPQDTCWLRISTNAGLWWWSYLVPCV